VKVESAGFALIMQPLHAETGVVLDFKQLK
jgi:hypothetical protein